MQHSLCIKKRRIHAVHRQMQRIVTVAGINHIMATSPLNIIVARTSIDNVIPAGSGHPVNAARPCTTCHNVHRCERHARITHISNLPGMELGRMANKKTCRYLNKQFASIIRIKPIRCSICISSIHGNSQMRINHHKLAHIERNRRQITKHI